MNLIFSLILSTVSWQAMADIVKSLPKDDALGKTTRAIGTQLSDGNISTGTTNLWAGEIKPGTSLRSKDDVETLVRKGFAEAFKDSRDANVPKDAKLTVTIHKFVDGDGRGGDVAKMTDAVMESNDYNPDNKDLREAQARYLWVVLRRMPVSSKTIFAQVKTKMMSDVTEEMRSVQYFLLINPDKKAVQLFTIQGTM